MSTTNTVPSSSSPGTAIGPKLVVVDGKSYIYRNGELTARNFGYLVSTKSAINKFGYFERRREKRCGVCHPSFAESEAWDFSIGQRPDAVIEECSQPEKPAQIISQTEFDDRIERKGIALRTRLHLDKWVWEPAYNVVIDHDELFDILWRAERLAKRCLWRWLRTNRPKKCEWYGIHYLSDMDFGRDRLSLLTFGDAELYDYRWTKSHEVMQALEELIILRNKVHHFNGSRFRISNVDEHLYDVQRLAVLLYDEETATSARGLRSRLQKEAEGVSREIEMVWLLTTLPFAGNHPWQHHHIRLFQRVSWRLGQGDDERVRSWYSPAVIAATQEYQERKGYMSWDCEPDVQESLANVKRLDNGGYGGALPPGSEHQRGRTTLKSCPKPWRSASTKAARSLSFRGQQAHARNSTRRASFCVGGSAEDRSLL